MSANKGLGIGETKGTFQVCGVVLGVTKDTFYKETTTKKNKPFRSLSFGVQVAKDSIIYVTLTGMEQEKAYFSKTENGKSTTINVPWADRFKAVGEGYRLIGVNCGVEKTYDEKGKEVNAKRNLTPYDACKYASEHLKDGVSVFVKGKIEYSHYTKDNNVLRSVKFVPTQISLCKDIDFEKEDFTPTASFGQTLVYMGQRDENGKHFIDAKIVNYSTIEDAEFVVENPKLGKNLKSLKPYTAMKMWGDIRTLRNSEPVEDTDDGWGDPNPMDRVSSPYQRELLITGADPKTIDVETFSQAVIEKAVGSMNTNDKAKDDYGESDWGTKGADSAEEDSAW